MVSCEIVGLEKDLKIMATSHEAGQDIDAYCTKCKLVLAHVIIALRGTRPAKVECKTCKSIHAYRKEAPGKKAVSPRNCISPVKRHNCGGRRPWIWQRRHWRLSQASRPNFQSTCIGQTSQCSCVK